MAQAKKTDRLILTQRGATYVAFLEAGYTSDQALELTEYSLANPDVLLEDCRLQRPRPMILANA